MTKEKTTLILGAGASKPYEFPLGSELRQMIINLASDHVEIAKLMSIEPDHLAKFIASFRASHNVSIDSFLAAYRVCGRWKNGYRIYLAEV